MDHHLPGGRVGGSSAVVSAVVCVVVSAVVCVVISAVVHFVCPALAMVLWAVPVKALWAVPVLLWRYRPSLGVSEEWSLTLTLDTKAGPTHSPPCCYFCYCYLIPMYPPPCACRTKDPQSTAHCPQPAINSNKKEKTPGASTMVDPLVNLQYGPDLQSIRRGHGHK